MSMVMDWLMERMPQKPDMTVRSELIRSGEINKMSDPSNLIDPNHTDSEILLGSKAIGDIYFDNLEGKVWFSDDRLTNSWLEITPDLESLDIPEEYTQEDFKQDFAQMTTDKLVEGLTNKYFPDNGLTEGMEISKLTNDKGYQTQNGVENLIQDHLDLIDSDDIPEGITNKYLQGNEATESFVNTVKDNLQSDIDDLEAVVNTLSGAGLSFQGQFSSVADLPAGEDGHSAIVDDGTKITYHIYSADAGGWLYAADFEVLNASDSVSGTIKISGDLTGSYDAIKVQSVDGLDASDIHTAVNTTIPDLQIQITDNLNSLNSMQTEIDDMSTDITDLQTKTGDNETEITNLSNDLNDYINNHSLLVTRVDDLETQLNQIEADVQTYIEDNLETMIEDYMNTEYDIETIVNDILDQEFETKFNDVFDTRFDEAIDGLTEDDFDFYRNIDGGRSDTVYTNYTVDGGNAATVYN